MCLQSFFYSEKIPTIYLCCGAFHSLFHAAHKRRTTKRTKWVDLIFEVEKLKNFQLQKLNQPEKNTPQTRILYAVQNSKYKVPE